MDTEQLVRQKWRLLKATLDERARRLWAGAVVGNFKNGGREWQPEGEPELVDVHDFPGAGVGKAIPYGVYDVASKAGFVSDESVVEAGLASKTVAFVRDGDQSDQRHDQPWRARAARSTRSAPVTPRARRPPRKNSAS